MLKKILLLMLFFSITSCGYQAIHSKKNKATYDFSITLLNFTGNRDVNLRIKEKLNNYTLNKKDKNFRIKIDSITEKTILAKDLSGDPTSFKIMITVEIEILTTNDIKNNLTLVESFNYNNNNNKFDLKKYEREIKRNLAETVTKKIIVKLSNTE